MDLQLVSFIKCISILFLYGQYYYMHIEIQRNDDYIKEEQC